MELNRSKPKESGYLDRAEEQKERGHPFFPTTVFKDMVVATLILIIVVALAATLGAPLEMEANPTGSAKAPRPEWYFLFLFEALKYLPGHLEWVGAVLIPTLAIIALLLLPLYDRSPWRHPLNRPWASGIAVAALVAIAVLTFRAATAPVPAAGGAPSLASTLTPLEQAGKRAYDTHACAVCHRVNGVGGTIGPDLSTVGRRLDATWLIAHLERPEEVAPGTRMPRITLTNDELMSLTAYLLSLRQAEVRTPAQLGEAMFTVYCNSCHPGGRAGIGTNLIGLPAETVIEVTRAGRGGMPAFGPGELTDEQLNHIIAYLNSLQ